MRLVDLDPRWLTHEGRRVGFVFRSPTKPQWYQSCFVEVLPNHLQRDLAIKAFEDEDTGETVQLCKQGVAWTCTPPIEQASFESLSILPSIDGSPGGTWHGHITNGQIVGGL